MKISEIRDFETKHLIVDPDPIQKHSYGHEWSDIPFPEIERVTIECNESFFKGRNKIEPHVPEGPEIISEYEIFGEKFQSSSKDQRLFHRRFNPEKPTWFNILKTIDDLIDDSGDHHHVFLEVLEVDGTSLHIGLGS